MNRLILVAGLMAVAGPAFAAEYYIVQNPQWLQFTAARGSGSQGCTFETIR
jgi:hypothetical protein